MKMNRTETKRPAEVAGLFVTRGAELIPTYLLQL